VPQSLEGCMAGPEYKDETVSTTLAENMPTERAASDHASSCQISEYPLGAKLRRDLPVRKQDRLPRTAPGI
jgi:hypothetical protein